MRRGRAYGSWIGRAVGLAAALLAGGCTDSNPEPGWIDEPGPARPATASPSTSPPAALPAVVSTAEERTIVADCGRVPVDKLDRVAKLGEYRVVAVQADRYGRSALLRHPKSGAYAHCVTGVAARLVPVRERPPEQPLVEVSQYFTIEGRSACGPGDGKSCDLVLLSGAGVLPAQITAVAMTKAGNAAAGKVTLVDGHWLYRAGGQRSGEVADLSIVPSPGQPFMIYVDFPTPETVERDVVLARLHDVVRAHTDSGRYAEENEFSVQIGAPGLDSQNSRLVTGSWVESFGGERASGPVAAGVFGKDADVLAPGPKFERPCAVTPHYLDDADFRWSSCTRAKLPGGRTLIRAESDVDGLLARGVSLIRPDGQVASVAVRTGWPEGAEGEHPDRRLPEVPFSWEQLTEIVTDPLLVAT